VTVDIEWIKYGHGCNALQPPSISAINDALSLALFWSPDRGNREKRTEGAHALRCSWQNPEFPVWIITGLLPEPHVKRALNAVSNSFPILHVCNTACSMKYVVKMVNKMDCMIHSKAVRAMTCCLRLTDSVHCLSMNRFWSQTASRHSVTIPVISSMSHELLQRCS